MDTELENLIDSQIQQHINELIPTVMRVKHDLNAIAKELGLDRVDLCKDGWLYVYRGRICGVSEKGDIQEALTELSKQRPATNKNENYLKRRIKDLETQIAQEVSDDYLQS